MTEQGLILVSYGSRGVVQLDDGRQMAAKYRRSVGRPYCGDRVGVESADGESAVVTAIHERQNEFARANARGQKQVVAANLDQVLIVIAPAPEPSRDLVERYLVAAHSLGIKPVIVVNKADGSQVEAAERVLATLETHMWHEDVDLRGRQAVDQDTLAGQFLAVALARESLNGRAGHPADRRAWRLGDRVPEPVDDGHLVAGQLGQEPPGELLVEAHREAVEAQAAGDDGFQGGVFQILRLNEAVPLGVVQRLLNGADLFFGIEFCRVFR